MADSWKTTRQRNPLNGGQSASAWQTAAMATSSMFFFSVVVEHSVEQAVSSCCMPSQYLHPELPSFQHFPVRAVLWLHQADLLDSSQPFLWRQCCKVRCCCSLSVWLCATDEAVQPRRWMDVLDIPDQYAVYYFFLRKTVKWTLEKALFWLIKTAVVDSYILCNCTVIPRRPNHLAYWRAIAESLTNKKLAYKKKPHLFASKIYSTFTWTISKPHLP